MYIAIDQYGNHVHIRKHPRKSLMDWAYTKHAEKIYIDKEGKATHVGYVVRGHWFNVYKIKPFKE